MEFHEARAHIGKSDWLEVFQAYLNSGGDIDHCDDLMGWTLLHSAAENGNVQAIRWLVENGADIDIRSQKGWTPLHQAVDADSDGAIQVGEEPQMVTTRTLIELGAAQTVRNKKGETPRDIVAAYGERALALYDSITRE